MPLRQSEAIILRTFNIGEQDKLVICFTRKRGVIRGVAKGARKFGNRFGSSLEPLSLVNTFYYEKEGKDLVTFSNCDLLESFFEIQKNLDVSFHLNYFVELIEEFFPVKSKDDRLYRLLHTCLQALSEGADISFIRSYFEAWFLKFSGILPDFKRCKKCRSVLSTTGWLSTKKDGVFCDDCTPQKRDGVNSNLETFLTWTRKNPPSKEKDIPIPLESLSEISGILQSVIIFHMEKTPKALSFIKRKKE